MSKSDHLIIILESSGQSPESRAGSKTERKPIPKNVIVELMLNQKGVVHTFPLLLIIAFVGIISFLLISSAGPFKGELFNSLFPKPPIHAVGTTNSAKYFQINHVSSFFIVKITDSATIQAALDDMNGPRKKIVAGIVQLGNDGYNLGGPNNGFWSWHLDPSTIILGDAFIEICDGGPLGVEQNLTSPLPGAGWLGKQFCPWNGRISAVFDIPPLPSSIPTPSPASTMTPTPSPLPSLPPCPLGILGDINCDGKIDIFDYNILVTNFGKTVPKNTTGDLDGDGLVGIFDYNILVTNFGKHT